LFAERRTQKRREFLCQKLVFGMVELSAFRLAVHGGVSAGGGKIFELEVPNSRFYQGDQQAHRISPLRGVLAKHRGAVRWIAVMLAWAQECTRKQYYVYIFFFFCFSFSNVYLTAHVNATCAHTHTHALGSVRVHANGGGNAPPPPSPLPAIYQHTHAGASFNVGIRSVSPHWAPVMWPGPRG
jgi:hypothetical protein